MLRCRAVRHAVVRISRFDVAERLAQVTAALLKDHQPENKVREISPAGEVLRRNPANGVGQKNAPLETFVPQQNFFDQWS